MNRKNYNKSMNPTPSKLRFLSLAGGGVGYFRRSAQTEKGDKNDVKKW
uniref:Uncharacterized protein n=1 Tax=uncultured Desulfobacterium sp. TaxID=201089 RepID=E1YKI0_9BACT|nr:unknown protein [uncultured Desulfobacterium sp.]